MLIFIICIVIFILIASVFWSLLQEKKGREELTFFTNLNAFVQIRESKQLQRDDEVLSPEGWRLLEDIVIVEKESSQDVIEPCYRRGRMMVSRLPVSTTKPGRWGYLAPTLLTMMGIWGTFWGINVGLAETNMTSHQSTTALMKNAQTLFQGMQTAFITSLVGMGAAILTMGFVALVHHRYFKRNQQIQKILQSIFFCEPATAHLARISMQIQTLHKQVEQLSSAQKAQQQDLTTHLQIAVSEMTTQVGDLMESQQHPPDPEASLNALRDFINSN